MLTGGGVGGQALFEFGVVGVDFGSAVVFAESILINLFGTGKGSGAAFLFAVLWLAGIGVCLIFRADKYIWKLEKK